MSLSPIDRYSVSYVKYLEYGPQMYPGKLELLNGLLQEVNASVEGDVCVKPIMDYLLDTFVEFRSSEIRKTYSEKEQLRHYANLVGHDSWEWIRICLFDDLWRRYEQSIQPRPKSGVFIECEIATLMLKDGYMIDGGNEFIDYERSVRGFCRRRFLEFLEAEYPTPQQLCEWIIAEVEQKGTDINIREIIPLNFEANYWIRKDLVRKYDGDSKHIAQYCVESLIETCELEHLSRSQMEYTLLDSMQRRFDTPSAFIAHLEHNASSPPRDNTLQLSTDVRFLIASKLPYKDIYSLSQASKEWDLFREGYDVRWRCLYQMRYFLKPPSKAPQQPVFWRHLFQYQEAALPVTSFGHKQKPVQVRKFFVARFNETIAKCIKFQRCADTIIAKEAWDTLKAKNGSEERAPQSKIVNNTIEQRPMTTAPTRVIDIGPAIDGQTRIIGRVIELSSIIKP